MAYFHLLNFLVMIIVTIYLMSGQYGHMENWSLAIYIYYLILGIAGMILAVWMALDGKRLERYATNMKKLEEKLIELEKKIRIITPRNKEKKV